MVSTHMRDDYPAAMSKPATLTRNQPPPAELNAVSQAPGNQPEHLANIRAKEYVLALLARTGLDLTKLAERAGLHQTTVTRPMNDKSNQHHLTRRTVQRLSEVFNVPVASEVLAGLKAGRATREEALHRPPKPRGQNRAPAIAPPTATARDVPIQAAIMSGRGSHFYLNPAAMDHATRPPALTTARKVFAIRMPDGSMAPWRRIGELVFVDPSRPVAPGDHALVELQEPNNPNGEPIFLIRRVVALAPKPGTPPQLAAYTASDAADTLAGLRMVRLARVLEWAELLGM